MAMLRSILLLFLLLSVVGCDTIIDNANKSIFETVEESEVEARFINATVERVVDGDTIVVRLENGTEERVRLLLIDTPESVHPSKPVQPFGIEASEFAKSMLTEGKAVQLELDIGERDRYGRLLAYVWIGDTLFNEVLLQKGLARVAYVFEPNTKYVDRFYNIQKQAQSEGIGIWSIENYVLEDGFSEEAVSSEEAQEANAGVSESCSNPAIKGNHSSGGELIYHVPGGQYYNVTNPEQLFCTEEEATLAGYRKSKR